MLHDGFMSIGRLQTLLVSFEEFEVSNVLLLLFSTTSYQKLNVVIICGSEPTEKNRTHVPNVCLA